MVNEIESVKSNTHKMSVMFWQSVTTLPSQFTASQYDVYILIVPSLPVQSIITQLTRLKNALSVEWHV